MSGGKLSRRGLLMAGGATILAAGGAGALTVGTASAAVPGSKRFDLSKPAYDVFRKVLLDEKHHALQGMAFDTANRHLFIAQIRDGSPGDDLCINRLDESGKVTGKMHIDSAGHGVSIGVEPSGEDTYIWVECDSSGGGDDGRGTALARFKFADGKAPSGVKKFFTGSKTITCATDPVNKRILVRRKESGKFTYRLYDFSSIDVENGTFTDELAKITQPELGDGGVTFQGYTVFGSYLYTLDGDGHADQADINSFITTTDLNTGKVVERALTKAGKSLVYREPEGMAINQTADGEVRLCFGFASRTSVGNIDRYANVFHKNVLV
ncbi:teichoic acid biosynthesis protein C [Streptomyces nanshensis]|uniref:Teichoic acid biosynthesis protein C n=1 Tax=Streptomyces nanshensis TaxID=518642 RepID=A0A1E7L524_9ACTN|nr:teichoic acid biosynthesis protein C [Streptomyces nanshensis]OEV11280.1 teichoic acid biosynthesis protein C [Streptomyces nanshensis]